VRVQGGCKNVPKRGGCEGEGEMGGEVSTLGSVGLRRGRMGGGGSGQHSRQCWPEEGPDGGRSDR
jgi:hypothetical protein